MKTTNRCIYCGRPAKHRRVVKRVTAFGEIRESTRFYCNPSLEKECKPFQPDEILSDPALTHYWCDMVPDRVHEIDLGILPLVCFFNERGWRTVFSCDGHGVDDPYIDFLDRHHRARALGYLSKKHSDFAFMEEDHTPAY